MLGLRNLYRAFNESRTAVRKRMTLAVAGELPEAGILAELLGAGKGAGASELLVSVIGARSGGVELYLSGGVVEDEGIVSLSALTEEAVVQELVPRVVEALDEEYLITLGRAYPIFRRAVCERIIGKDARQNAVIGALPIPGADMPAITANQSRMVLAIAAAYDEEISLDRARELLGVLAAGFSLRALARQVVKLLPIGGWAASGAIGYAGTLAMGRAAMLYFERGGGELQPGEASEMRWRVLKEAERFLSRISRK